MARAFHNVEELLHSTRPDSPVYCIYPHVYDEVARHFLAGFPGRVLYAVKANNHPYVIRALHAAGVHHFDCASLQEIELVHSLCEKPACYLMNPVRLSGDAATAHREFGTRHFMIDHASGLGPLLAEIDAGESVIFARMAISHHSAMLDLSSKFGARPDELPALLEQIRAAGAEAALAFNVGTGVTEPEAYTCAMNVAREVLAQTPFPIRLLDIGGGFPRPYPGLAVPPLDEYFAAIKGMRHELVLAENSDILAEPGRGLAAPGMSTVTRVLLRKEDRLYLNDGMYGAFWELRFKCHVRYPARCLGPLEGPRRSGAPRSFRLFGPTCDSSDEMPGTVELPSDIDVGDYIEFGSMGAYSLSGRTTFNGFYSDNVVLISSDTSLPPA